MAASTPTKGASQKLREFSEEDVSVLCKNIEESLFVPEKSVECCGLLKQLLQHMQTYANGSKFFPQVPPSLIKGLVQVMSEHPHTKATSVTQKYLLSQMIVSDHQVVVPAAELLKLAASKAGGNADNALIYLTQGQNSNCLDQIIPYAKQWMLSQDLEDQKTGVSFLQYPDVVKYLDEETASVVSERLAHWLSNTGLVQAPNPRTLNPFRKDEELLVTEVDGTPSTNMFTVLNLGQYFTDEQLINMHSFSCLYSWLYYAAKRFGQSKEDNYDRIAMEKTVLSKVVGSLVPKSIDYCFRLIDQAERKAKSAVDAELQVAVATEAVRILDLICLLDPDQTARVFQEIKRLNMRISQEPRFVAVHVYIITFFFHHSATVVHDPRDSYQHYFTTLLPSHLNNQLVVSTTVDFIVKNLQEITDTTDILTSFFPSIFKIIAWFPRLFMNQFTEILPMAMDLETSVEMFHLLLDLPCTTAALEVMEKASKMDVPSVAMDTEPSNPAEAFHNIRYKPLFLYITRSTSRQGDTIDRLSQLHAVLRECLSSTRVMVCCQVMIVLLRIWFRTVRDSDDPEFLAQLVPVIIERSSILVAVPELVKDVHTIFAKELLLLVEDYPSIVTIQQMDIKEFIQSTANMAGRAEIYSNMVYAIGEFASPTHSSACTNETIGNFYECLEVVAYELLGQLTAHEHDESIPKTLNCCNSALAKLASRCQDLIPRAILCLTKVVKQQHLLLLPPMTKNFIVNRASMLIGLLKSPDTAYTILNPPSEIYTDKWHQNNTSMPTILRSMERILRKNITE